MIHLDIRNSAIHEMVFYGWTVKTGEENADPEAVQSLPSLLSDALQAVVFGNGYLVVVIGVIFVLAVMLSRFFKGGAL